MAELVELWQDRRRPSEKKVAEHHVEELDRSSTNFNPCARRFRT